MSHKLINHNADLKKLRDDGYEIEVKNGHLLVHSIPYINPKKEVSFGVLVTSLGDLSGDRTTRPQDHVIYFKGEHPCDKEGNLLNGIRHASEKKTLVEGIEIDHSFSNKPTNGYSDYYEKVTTYEKIISSQAESIDRTVTARTFKVVETEDSESPFNYLDANSSRSGIGAISEKLKNLKIAIVGLGGTGSYILDFVAKTCVQEIHLFDRDSFLSHNAFRAPGSISLDELVNRPKKVEYLYKVYSKMHKRIIPHEYNITRSVLQELLDMNFVFLSIDDGAAKRSIINKLIINKVPFVDVGIGVNEVDGMLTGSIRVTTSTKEKFDHIPKRVSFSDNESNDYGKNIQIAEINAINAALAVIKWKKILGFYHDLSNEHHTIYEINTNKLLNDEAIT